MNGFFILRGTMGRTFLRSSTTTTTGTKQRVRLLLTSSLTVLATSFTPNFLNTRGVTPRIPIIRLPNPWQNSQRVMATRTNHQADELEELLAREEFHDVLPLEKGSHNSAKLMIPSDRTNDTDDFCRDSFRDRLESTITACRELGKSSLWVHVPMSRASLIEDMVEFGLTFHHASGDVAVLNLWLLDDLESKIPEFATHNVGVGAVVINSRNEILCVRELRRNYLPWKVPTGLTELSESLDEAAIREVMEETGVPTTFHSVLSFRQTHGLAHGRSDMFFVCRLDPIESVDECNGQVVIPEPNPQVCEIETAAWVPYQEYRDMVMDPDKGHPMMQHVVRVLEAKQKIEKTVVGSVVPGRAPNDVFFPAAHSEKEDIC